MTCIRLVLCWSLEGPTRVPVGYASGCSSFIFFLKWYTTCSLVSLLTRPVNLCFESLKSSFLSLIHFPDPKSCAEISRCSTGFPDGNYHFPLDPKNSSGVELYCHGMNTTNAKTFINLAQESYSYYGGGTLGGHAVINRTFTKVAVDTEVRQNAFPEIQPKFQREVWNSFYSELFFPKHFQNMEVIRNDFTFASPSTPPVHASRFAETGACHDGSHYGKMVVDLRGTPFQLDPSVSSLVIIVIICP